MKKSLLILVLLTAVATEGQTPREAAIEVTASFASPSGIVLSWPPYANSTYTVARKTKDATLWGTATTQSSPYTDSTVAPGEEYEYEIIRRNPNEIVAYGYIAVAVQKPRVVSRGKVILIVANTHAAALAGELAQLRTDLIGDGWTVIRHDVQPDSAANRERVGTVKGLIQANYNADPANVKSVFLIGHVPVPYSGRIKPGTHTDHWGPWVADTYYAEMNGTWDDVETFETSGTPPNVPGDWRFDEHTIPTGDVELELGRVDFANLTDFSNKTPSRSELDLLRAYLRRNHEFRHGNLVAERKGFIMDFLSWHGGDAFAATPWRMFSGFFGSANITATSSDYIGGLIGTTRYLWSFGAGGGDHTSMVGLYQPVAGDPDFPSNSADWFAVKNPKTIFAMLMGSYFGDWNRESNLLRSGLASGDCLAVMWSGRPHWYVHWMRVGETIGHAAKLSTNNKIPSGAVRPLYKSYRPDVESYYPENGINSTHISLLGDPTLRMDVVKPVKNLRMTVGPTDVTIIWEASGEGLPAGVFAGYDIYKATSSSGPFTYQGNTTLTTFSQPKPSSGNVVYTVKAAKWEGYDSVALKGAYWNTSIGIVTPAYTIASLGTLSYGGTFSAGYGINSLGDVTGSADTDYPYTDVEHAIRKLSGGSIQDIAGLSSKSVGFAINTAGIIVGYGLYYDGYNPSDWRAFKWNPSPTPTWTFLSKLTASSYYSEANSINANGDIAGFSQNSSGVNRAVRWDGGTGAANDLLTLDPNSGPTKWSYAYGINSAKKVVGRSITASGVARAFRTGGGVAIDPANNLGTISGNASHSSEGQAINDFDEVVGASHNSAGEYHAFFKTGDSAANAGFTDLGTLGGNLSAAYAMNNLGQVVGSGRTTTLEGSEKTSIWMKGWSSMQNLNQFLPMGSNWDLREAHGINDAGQITGWGYYGGQRLGFLLTPN